MQYIENRTYDEIEIDDHAEIARTLKKDDIELFAVESGGLNPAHVDGPLACDNAISRASAKTKGIASPVAGDAGTLVVPDLESGNLLVKQLISPAPTRPGLCSARAFRSC